MLVGTGKRPLDESEDKAIARLAITYGVLRRLGFSDTRVDECLNAIDGVDLEEAYEWVIRHLIKLHHSLLIILCSFTRIVLKKNLGIKVRLTFYISHTF
jgi:ATP-dependent RNA helicase DHX29